MKTLNDTALIFFVMAATWAIIGISTDISKTVSFSMAVIFFAIGMYYQNRTVKGSK